MWGESHGIDKQNIKLGIAIQDYSKIKNRLKRSEEDRVQIRDQNNELKEKESQAFVDATDSTIITKIKEQIESNQIYLTKLKKLVADTKKELASSERFKRFFIFE